MKSLAMACQRRQAHELSAGLQVRLLALCTPRRHSEQRGRQAHSAVLHARHNVSGERIHQVTVSRRAAHLSRRVSKLYPLLQLLGRLELAPRKGLPATWPWAGDVQRTFRSRDSVRTAANDKLLMLHPEAERRRASPTQVLDVSVPKGERCRLHGSTKLRDHGDRLTIVFTAWILALSKAKLSVISTYTSKTIGCWAPQTGGDRNGCRNAQI